MEDNGAYDDFQDGTRLLGRGDVHAAAVALERARAAEPGKGSIREALARAYYAAGRFEAAEIEFTAAIEIDPVNDYAYFGLGMCRLRARDLPAARRNLRLAVAMRPDNADYRRALDEAGEPDRPGDRLGP